MRFYRVLPKFLVPAVGVVGIGALTLIHDFNRSESYREKVEAKILSDLIKGTTCPLDLKTGYVFQTEAPEDSIITMVETGSLKTYYKASVGRQKSATGFFDDVVFSLPNSVLEANGPGC